MSTSLGQPPPTTNRAEIIAEVDEAIKKLHADEFVGLAGRDDAIKRIPIMGYLYLCFHVFKGYWYFFFTTWGWTIWNICTLPMALFDIFSQLYWATFSSLLLAALAVTCLILRQPDVAAFYQVWSKKYGAGLSLINSPKPSMLSSLTSSDLDAAKNAMSQKISESGETYTSRTFDLDIAKVLLICASLMYERPEEPHNKVLSLMLDSLGPQWKEKVAPVLENAQGTKPGQPLENLLGARSARAVQDLLASGEDTASIKAYASKMGLEFHVISELNSQGTSCCGLFYSPDHNFIILAFKGTSASEFDEWLTDCSFTPVQGGAWLRGFGNVQKGFLDRMFPAKVQAGVRLPWDTIRLATSQVSEILSKYRPGNPEINIYFTGHSLGCATASIAYARANLEPEELGSTSAIRDGYIFAAPLMCDIASVNAFNNRMYHNPTAPRTLWRITQGRDFVATGLPAGGDVPERRLSPFNMFGYAHLGTELTMKNPPLKSVLSGQHLIPGCQVKLHTAVIPGEGGATAQPTASPDENTLLKIMTILTYVPVINRMIDHCTFMYYDQLCRLQKGDAVWEKKLF